MSHLTFPEDSTLKRHFESTVEMKRQRWLQQPPSDSTLNRHVMSASRHVDIKPQTIKGISTKPRPSSQNIRVSGVVKDMPSEKGVLARFFSLFSRNT